jgi:hypothetical protein
MDRNQTRPCDDYTREVPTLAHPLSRRHLLGAAAGGFALATSGLLVPEWLVDEAEAGEHPVRRIQGRKEQQRQKRHHRRENRRQLQRRQDDQKGNHAPGAFIDGIRWGIYSPPGTGAFDIEFWAIDPTLDVWVRAASRHVQGEFFVELRTTNTIGVLWINRRYYFDGTNSFGTLKVSCGYGGSIGGFGWSNGTTVVDDFALPRYGSQAPDMVVDGFKFSVSSNGEDDDFKKPSLDIRRQ